MDALMSDIRFAVRGLSKAKLFTLVSLASLALGIGACVTIFSVVDAIVLRPLPYVEPDRLVDLHETSATKLCGGCGVGTSYPGFLDWQSQARSFSRMGAYIERPFAVSGTEAAERVPGALISADVFPLLGTGPVLGRGFTADDDRVGAAPVVLLSDALWTRRYAADRRIVGQTIRVNVRVLAAALQILATISVVQALAPPVAGIYFRGVVIAYGLGSLVGPAPGFIGAWCS